MTGSSHVTTRIPVACATEAWFEHEFCRFVASCPPRQVLLAFTDDRSESEYLVERYIARLQKISQSHLVIDLPKADPILAITRLLGDAETPLTKLRRERFETIVVSGAQWVPNWYLSELLAFLQWLANATGVKVLLARPRQPEPDSAVPLNATTVPVPCWRDQPEAERRCVFNQLVAQAVADSELGPTAPSRVLDGLNYDFKASTTRAALEAAIRSRLCAEPGRGIADHEIELVQSRLDMERRFTKLMSAIDRVNERFERDIGFPLVEPHHHQANPFAMDDLLGVYLQLITTLYVRICDYPGKGGLYELSTKWSVSADPSRLCAEPHRASTDFVELLSRLRAWAQHGLNPGKKDDRKTLDAVRGWHVRAVQQADVTHEQGRRLCHALLLASEPYATALEALSEVPLDQPAIEGLKSCFQRWKRRPSDHWIEERVRDVIRAEKLNLDAVRTAKRINAPVRQWINNCVLPDEAYRDSLEARIKCEVLTLDPDA
jgi:hypothetical protein